VVNERDIDAIFRGLDQGHAPGAAVGIAVAGVPRYRRGFGLASVELPVCLSPSMRMRIGSTSKQFTALAYMLLSEEGRARIDEPIGTYLPELHAVARRVTARQLMGNISGLRDATDIVQQFGGVSGRHVTTSDLISLYRDVDDTNADPGSTFIYNNGGWVMLSAAIERITGQSLEQVTRERIFVPLGMHDTEVRRWDFSSLPNSASTHALNAAGSYERAEYCGGIDYAGAGAIVSTVDDMLRWLASMDAPRVGSESTWALMRTPQILANGTSTGYGLGLRVGKHRGVETLYHSGGGIGSNAQMLKVPSARLDIIVMVNRSDVSAVSLAESILDVCLPDLEPAPQAAENREKLHTGVFRSARTDRIVQLFARQGQQIASIDGFDMPMVPDAEGVLWPMGALGAWKRGLTLLGGADESHAVRLVDFGQPDELVRQAPGQPDVAAIVGTFRSETTGTDAVISMTADGPRLCAMGRFGSAQFALEYLAAGVWRANALHPWVKPPWGVLVFSADERSFHYSNILTRKLRFGRA
jgi:D-aminopeptidase